MKRWFDLSVRRVDEIEKTPLNTEHDPQEEEYAKLANTEGDKFDSRLFWFAGGVGALSLGYFQTTGLLRIDWLLVSGYACLIVGIVSLLASLQLTSYVYGELSVLYRKKNQPSKEPDRERNQKKIDKYGAIISRGVLALNIVSMLTVLIGTILLIVFLFLSM